MNTNPVKIAGTCGKDDCPAIYSTGIDSTIVRGVLRVDVSGVTPSEGEALVEIPTAILLEAARALGR